MSFSSTSQQLPVLTTLCPICYTNPPKYRCPRCSMRTCSMDCFKAHKIRAACSGIRDPTKYLRKADMKASTIDMDYSFLKSVRNTHEGGKKKIDKVSRGGAPNKRRNRSEYNKSVVLRNARRRRIKLRRLPAWMEKTQNNKTEWNGQSKCILWTVEWIITMGDETKTIVEDKVSESGVLKDLVAKHISEPEDGIHILMKKARQPYYIFDAECSLLDNLRGLKVFEFPSISVVDKIPDEWHIIEKSLVDSDDEINIEMEGHEAGSSD